MSAPPTDRNKIDQNKIDQDRTDQNQTGPNGTGLGEPCHDEASHREILEAALSALDEGIAVLDAESRVLFWSPAAAAITGYSGAGLLARKLPIDFYHIDRSHTQAPGMRTQAERPLPVHLRHHQGHTLPAMLRRIPLRDAFGHRFGTLLRFHPIDEIDTLPRGALTGDSALEMHIEQSQAGMEERLYDAWHEWTADSIPFGILWITVDQATMLRKTHGQDASESMLGIIERTLLHGLRPTEILSRWGSNEFLVLCHERTPEMLSAHARHLADLATTADFRWWGDRVPLTLSIGTAQVDPESTSLATLLRQAQASMQAHGIEPKAQLKSATLIELKPAAPEARSCSQS